ncbi:hypothetical protein MJO28_004975 [Puccinia striiformis f. sp. tritici]|uniref:Uncharacterized protein n=1 Tax=Puccinia striiformis f. sp. tritici TaxID=168172 RepID=A0ACC0EJK3_9BASI|nr:hypothetical protein MJO28_004975 [Puccinia striiformis f. sp. tritici]
MCKGNTTKYAEPGQPLRHNLLKVIQKPYTRWKST